MGAATPGAHRVPVIGTGRRLLPFAAGGRRTFATLVATSAVGGLLEALVLVLITRMAASLTDADASVAVPLLGDRSRGAAVLLAGGLLLVKLGAQVVGAHQAAGLASRSLTGARVALTRAHLRATWDHRSARPLGALQELLTTHVDRVASILLVAATGLVASANGVVLVLVALVVDPVSALVITVTGAGLALLMRPLTVQLRQQAERHVTTGRTYASAVAEATATSRDIQVLDVVDPVARRLDRLSAASVEPYRRSRLLTALAPNVYQTVALGAVLAALAVVGADGPDQVARLGAVVILLLRALSFSQQAQSSLHTVTSLVPYLDDLHGELEAHQLAARPVGGQDLDRVGSVAFDHVTFRYREAGVDALADLHLTIPHGAALGVVGPSGSGKSTLVALLLRLRDPSAGRLLVDGTPVDEVSLSSWYGRVAYVPQDPTAMAGTIADTIDFHRGHDRAAVERAAERAHVADEVRALPDGFDTVIGAGGRSLSGGQLQRISLARALLGQPDLLVLDEPTSALDARSEAAVTETLAAIHGEVTLVIVAHRLSTLDRCDRILVLDGGRTTAMGTHDDLVADPGFYADAVRLGGRSS